MPLTDLKIEFPGLFAGDTCHSISEAEGYADSVSAGLGFAIRVASWTENENLRVLQYRDRGATIDLRVEIHRDSTSGSRPLWLFRSSAERLDIGLRIQSPDRLRATPSLFEQDAKDMLRRLRRVRCDASGRLVGRLKRWDCRKEQGLIECVPGALVLVQNADLPEHLQQQVRQFKWFSFELLRTPHGQKAIQVRPVGPNG